MAETTMNQAALPSDAVSPEQTVPQGIWSEFLAQPAVRRTLPLAVTVFALLVMVMVYMSLNKASYRPLFPGMSGVDQAAAFESLQKAGLTVEIDAATGSVSVPADLYHQAKMVLASQGIPATSTDGFAMIRDQQSMGTSQFIEQKRYQLAIEEELGNSISSIQAVQTARVHLAVPKQSVFVRNRVEPTASVILTLAQGRRLSESQAQAVVHMVASSVPYLEAANVSVVDQFGNLLANDQDLSGLGMSDKQLSYRNKLEKMYQQRIQSLLGPLVGANKLRAEVNADMDFTVQEMTQENYNPDTIAIRSEQLSRSGSQKEDVSGEGVPGALSNEPPLDPVMQENQDTSIDLGDTSGETEVAGPLNRTRNYEIDRTIQHTKLATGELKRLSISVVIDEPLVINNEGEQVRQPLTADQVERFQSLVKTAVGFDDQRGDNVTVLGMAFQIEAVIPETPLWEQNWAQDLVRQLLIAILALVFILVVLRPAIKRLVTTELATDASDEAIELGPDGQPIVQASEEALIDGESLEDMKARMRPKKSSVSMDMLDTANSYDDKVALMRMLVTEDSKRVAGVMSNWVKQDL
ncbi:MAG: flagellar M-ring protein FliF [Piscirickettsiaceae bacterium]|jgi:flagellar M-ring protein FliF|nr:flagellar M-ring protein FliF [Piscirickettsiaceae bacterium]